LRPRTRFDESVLGAVGRTLGERCPALSGAPGPSLIAVADILEEVDGTGFVVQLEGAAGATRALVTVEDARGHAIPAVAPFADGDGRFALEVAVEDARVAFFVANGALVDPPEYATVRVVLADDEARAVGYTGFALHPRRAEPIEFADYARPFAELAWAVAMADGTLAPAEKEQIGLQLETVLGGDDAGLVRLSVPPGEPPKVSALAVSLRCRFAELDSEELFFALLGVAASDGVVSPAEIALLRKVARRLDVPDRAWQRWAFRMGVDLPDPDTLEATDAALDQRPPLVILAERHGQRVPSIILRIDREGQDRRNVFATLSLLAGILGVLAWLGAMGLVLTPIALARYVVPLAGALQLFLSLLAVALGGLGLRVARHAEGAGQGGATSGLALGVVGLMLGLVWWFVVCLGLSATAYWDQGN